MIEICGTDLLRVLVFRRTNHGEIERRIIPLPLRHNLRAHSAHVDDDSSPQIMEGEPSAVQTAEGEALQEPPCFALVVAKQY